MCGINGFNFQEVELIGAMNRALQHRGPDDRGVWNDAGVTLGQVRLSIIDLSSRGQQPIFYARECGASNACFNSKNIANSPLSLVFNGEIYNYQNLKIELLNKGYCFTTDTDSEVILAAFLEWGEDCFSKFNGMWSVAIYDRKKQQLILSRDRLGQKPLYYYELDGVFIFSSQLKGILEWADLKKIDKNSLNKNAINFYFSLGFIPSPVSIYQHISKLPAGHILKYNLKNKTKTISRYFAIPEYNPIFNKKQLIKKCKKILYDATKLRLHADVKVGAFLSGGLDSSAVLTYMRKMVDISKLHTFSIGFISKAHDESKFINIVKKYLNTNHTHHYFDNNDFDELEQSIATIYDEPFADQSVFPTCKVAGIASKGVTVALTGDGGDEIFGGYPKHKLALWVNRVRLMPRYLIKLIYYILRLSSNIRYIKNVAGLPIQFLEVVLSEPEFFDISIKRKERFVPTEVTAWYKLTYQELLNKMPFTEAVIKHNMFFGTLQDNFLVKTDRASMQYALELRSPFLDYRFIELSMKIPTNYKINKGWTKKILRDVLQNELPESIIYRKDKQGFSPPLMQWLKDKKISFSKVLANLTKAGLLTDDVIKFYHDAECKKINLPDIYLLRIYFYDLWCRKWIYDYK